MSHTVTCETEIKDMQALKDACKKLGLDTPALAASAKTYDGTTTEGTVVKLPGWRYPIVIKADGTVVYDNFNGAWGSIDELNKLKQRYAAEKTHRAARRRGYATQETKLKDGSVKVTVKL